MKVDSNLPAPKRERKRVVELDHSKENPRGEDVMQKHSNFRGYLVDYTVGYYNSQASATCYLFQDLSINILPAYHVQCQWHTK